MEGFRRAHPLAEMQIYFGELSPPSTLTSEHDMFGWKNPVMAILYNAIDPRMSHF